MTIDEQIDLARDLAHEARADSNAATAGDERRELSVVAGAWDRVVIALEEWRRGRARREKGKS